MNFNKILTSLFGNKSTRDMKLVKPLVEKVKQAYPEIEKLVMLQRTRDIILFLPESFEWLVLKSDLIEGVKSILKNPSEYIECKEFFSWERFFTKILVELTSKSYLQYNKNTLNPVYLQENEKKHIINSMPTIHW